MYVSILIFQHHAIWGHDCKSLRFKFDWPKAGHVRAKICLTRQRHWCLPDDYVKPCFIEKRVSPYLFLSYKHLKQILKKMIITCSPMIRHLFDTICVASTEKEW